MRRTLLAFAAVATLGASAPTTPLVHLEYAFADYDAGANSAKISDPFTGPLSGTLSVDFLGTAPDGGTLVQAQRWWWHEPRPEQAETCELYANANVTCSQYPIVSSVASVLLPMLARSYFGGIAAAAAATVKYRLVLPANFYAQSWTVALKVLHWSGPIATIATSGIAIYAGGPIDRERADGTVSYDRTKSLPAGVHAVLMLTSAGINDGETVDLKLTKGSL